MPVDNEANRSHRTNAAATTLTSSVPRLHGINYECLPSMYVLNAAGLEKIHAVEHLAAELATYNVDAAVILESHLEAKQTDSVSAVDGNIIYCRDRTERRGE